MPTLHDLCSVPISTFPVFQGKKSIIYTVLYFELHIIIILIALFPNTATVGSLEHDLVYNMFTWFSRKMFPYHHWLVNVKTDPQNKELIIHSNYFFLYTRKLKCRDVKDDASVYLVTKLRGHVFPNSCTYHTLPIWISPPPTLQKNNNTSALQMSNVSI